MNGYEGDEVFNRLLIELECPRSLIGIYGYLKGALVASNLVKFTQALTDIFLGKDPSFHSLEQAQRFMANLMGLWNNIASAIQEEKFLPQPNIKFPLTESGLMDRMKWAREGILAFIEGLDAGGTDPIEMSPDGQDALRSLSEAHGFFEAYQELIGKEKLDKEKIADSHKALDRLDMVVEDCIFRIAQGLKEAREVAYFRTTAMANKRKKIGRNNPCPCGSGKKYKNCCYLKFH